METISKTSHQHSPKSVEALSYNRVARTSSANFNSSNIAGNAGFLQTSVDYESNSMEPITNPDQHCTRGSSSSGYLEWEHCSNVMQQLQQQQQQLRYCDVVFHVHGATFQAHRCVLAACSTYLASVFRKKQAVRDTIRLTNFPDGTPTASTFQQLLLFAYTGAVLLPGVAAAEELLHLADYLQVPHLLNLCSRYLHQQLSSSNCLKVIELAQRYRLLDLDAAASSLLQANLSTVLTGNEVLGLGQHQLEQLILSQCRDKVANLSGEAMLACMMRWLLRPALLGGRSPDGVPVPSSSSHPTDVAPALLTLVPWRHVSVRFAEALLQTTVRCLGASHRLVSVLARCCLQHHLLPRHLHCLLQEEAEESAVDMAAFNDLAVRTAIQNYHFPIKEKQGVSLDMTRGRAPALDKETHPQTLRQNHLTDVNRVTHAVEKSECDREKQSSTDGFSVSLEAKYSDALKSLLDCFQQHARHEDTGRDLLMSPSSNCNGYIDNGAACLNTETSGMSRTIKQPPSGDKYKNAISSENSVKDMHLLQEKAMSYISKSIVGKEDSSGRCLPLPSMHSFGERFSQFTAENNDSCQDMAGHAHHNGSRREFRPVPSSCVEDEGNSDPRFIELHHHKREQTQKCQQQQQHQLHHLVGVFQEENPNPGVRRFESAPDDTSSCYRESHGTNTSEFSHVETDELRASERPRQELEQKMYSLSRACVNHHQQQNLSGEPVSCCSYMPPLKRSKVDVYHESGFLYGENVAPDQQNDECSSTNKQRLSYDPTHIYAPCYGQESFIPEDSSDTNLVESRVKPVPSPVIDTASSDTRSQFFVSSNPEESHVDEMRFNHAFAMFGKEPQSSESPRHEAVSGNGVMLSPVTSNTGDTFDDTCTSYFPQDMTVRKQVQPLLQAGDSAPDHLQHVIKDMSSSQTASCSQSSGPTDDSREQMQFRNPTIASSSEISARFRSNENNHFHGKPYLVTSTRCENQRKEHVQLHQSDTNFLEHFSADFIRQSSEKNTSADSQTLTDISRRHRLADVFSDHSDQNNKRLLSVDVDASRQKSIKKTDHRERYSKHLWLKRVSADLESNQHASHAMDSMYNSTEPSSYAISIERAIVGNQTVASVHSVADENLQAEDRSISQEDSKAVFLDRTVECSDSTPAALWASSPSRGTHDERDNRELNNPGGDLDQSTSFEERKSCAKECFNNSSSWLHAEDLLTTPEKMLFNTGLQNKSFLSMASSEFEKEGCAAVEDEWHGLVDGAAVTAHFCGHEEGSANSICTYAPPKNDRCITTSVHRAECHKESEENALGLCDKSENHRERRKEERWYNRNLLVLARDVAVSPNIKRDYYDGSESLAYKNAPCLNLEESGVKLDGPDNPYCENTLQTLKFKMYKTRRSLTEESSPGTAHAASQRRLSNILSSGKFENDLGSPSHETELAKKFDPSGLCASQVDNIKTLSTTIKMELSNQPVDILGSKESGRCFKQSLAKYRLRPPVEPVVSNGASPSVSTSVFTCSDDLLWDQDEDPDDPIAGVEAEDGEADGAVALDATTSDPIRKDYGRDIYNEVSQAVDGADAEAVIALSSCNHICDNDVPASISNGDAPPSHSQNQLLSPHSEKKIISTPKGSSGQPTHSKGSVPSECEGVVHKCEPTNIETHMKKCVASHSKDKVINGCTASVTIPSDVHQEDSMTALSSDIVAHDDPFGNVSSSKGNNDKSSLNSNNATIKTRLKKSISNKKELQSTLEVPGKRKKLKRTEKLQLKNQEGNLSAGDLKATCRPIHTIALSEEFEDHSISEATAVVPKRKRNPKARSHPLRRQDKRTCDICDHEFVGRLFFKHMMEHFPGPKHSCDTCERVFERIYHLLEHRLTHRDVKPHCCPHCPFSTTKRDNLRVHVLSHDDPNQLPFKCPHCERRFARRQLLEHHSTSHSDAKTQRCDLCAYTAKTKNQLALHKRTHTGAVYTCQFGTCAYSTSKKSHFTDHLLTHSERRFFSCSKCGSQYRTKTHLLRHQVSHLPQKPFACDQCDYSANRADRLKAHKKKMHSPPDASTNASLRRRRQQLKKRDGAQGLPALTDVKASSAVDIHSKGRKDQSPPAQQSSQDTSHTIISHPSGSVPSDRPTESSCSTRLPSIATLGKGSHGDSLSESSSYLPRTIIATTFVQTIHNGTRIECSQAELFSEMEGSTTTNLSLQPQVSGSPPLTTFSDFTDLHNATEQYSVQFPHPQGAPAKCPLPLPNGIMIDSTGDQSCTMADVPDAFVESTPNNVHGSHYPQESRPSSTAPTMSSNYNSIANHRDNSAVTFFRSHTSGVSKETSASGSTTLIIEYPQSHDTDHNEYGYTTLTAGEKQSDINSHLVEDQRSGNSSDYRRVGECLHEYRGTTTQSRVDGRWITYTTDSDGNAHEDPSWVDRTEHLAKEENHKTSDQTFTTTEMPTDQQRHLLDGVEKTENSTNNRNQILLKVGKHSLEPSNEARSHYFTVQDCESKRGSQINVDSNSGDTITSNSQSLEYFTVDGIVNHFRSSGCLGNSSAETDESCLTDHTDKQQSVNMAPSHNFPTSIPAVHDGESALVLVDSGEEHRIPVDNIDDGLNWYIKSSHQDDGLEPSLV